VFVTARKHYDSEHVCISRVIVGKILTCLYSFFDRFYCVLILLFLVRRCCHYVGLLFQLFQYSVIRGVARSKQYEVDHRRTQDFTTGVHVVAGRAWGAWGTEVPQWAPGAKPR